MLNFAMKYYCVNTNFILKIITYILGYLILLTNQVFSDIQ